MSRYHLIFVIIFTLFNSPTFAADSLEQLVNNASALKLNLFGDQLLQPEQAFEFSANVKNSNTIYVNWEVAPNYYLYREKIKLELVNAKGVKIGDYTIPNGFPKHDEAFGNVEIFSEDLNFDVPLQREDYGTQTVKLRAYFQGCAERGVCYPPMTKDVMLDLPVAHQLEALPEVVPAENQNIGLPMTILLMFSIVTLILSAIIAIRLKKSV